MSLIARLIVILRRRRPNDDVNPDGTSERLIGLYVADRELRAAAERVNATWLVKK